MTDETKRSCYTCRNQSLCFLKRRVYNALLPEGAWMFDGADMAKPTRVWTDVFDTLAEACNQYVGEQTEAEAREALAKFLPFVWEHRAERDKGKMASILETEPILRDYFDIDSPEVKAVME